MGCSLRIQWRSRRLLWSARSRDVQTEAPLIPRPACWRHTPREFEVDLAYSVSELATSAFLVSVVVIVARFVWTFPATYLPRWLIPAVRRADPSPPWQWPFALSFTGVRGVVSLAAALGIPLTTHSGGPFPQRDLILFLTFCVILVTLIGQGLTKPWVMRTLGLANAGRAERRADRIAEQDAGRQAAGRAAKLLDQRASEGTIPDEAVEALRAAQHARLLRLGDPASAPLGRGPAHRDTALGPDAVSCLLAPAGTNAPDDFAYHDGDKGDGRAAEGKLTRANRGHRETVKDKRSGSFANPSPDDQNPLWQF